MAQGFEVNWYEQEFEAAIGDTEAEVLDRAAMQCLGHARVNIRNNGQIDTGFMVNSGYVVTANQDGYGSVPVAGQGARQRAPEAPRGEHEAIVAFAAEYAIYQELRRSFLYRALTQTTREFGGIVKGASGAFR